MLPPCTAQIKRAHGFGLYLQAGDGIPLIYGRTSRGVRRPGPQRIRADFYMHESAIFRSDCAPSICLELA